MFWLASVSETKKTVIPDPCRGTGQAPAGISCNRTETLDSRFRGNDIEKKEA